MRAKYGISCLAAAAIFVLFTSLPAYSQTSTNVVNQLTLAYHAYLGRAPDQPGLEFWTNGVTSGQISIDDAIKSIATSPEAKTYNTAKLTNAYQTLLGRDPDPEGLAFWTNNVMEGKISLDEAILSIAQVAATENAAQNNSVEPTNASEEVPNTAQDSLEDNASHQTDVENNPPESSSGNSGSTIHISMNGNVISVSGVGSGTVLSISNSGDGIVLSISGSNSGTVPSTSESDTGIDNSALLSISNSNDSTVLSTSGSNNDTAPSTSSNDEEKIIAAYQTYLGRDPDQAGLDYWMNQISSDQDFTAEDAIKGISESSEARKLSVSNEIVEAFENYQHKTPDDNEKNYWLEQVLDGKMSLEDAVSQIRGEDQNQKEAKADQGDGTDADSDTMPDKAFYISGRKPYAKYGQQQGAFHSHARRSHDVRFRNVMSDIDKRNKERSDRRALGNNQGSGSSN